MIKRSKNIVAIATVSAMSFALVACGAQGDKEGLGTLGGAILGGVAGAHVGKGKGQLVATGLGALLGAAVGSQIGKSLDRADRLYLEQTTQRTLESKPSGHVEEWNNPDSGNYGTIQAEPAFQNNAGEYCREFQQTVTIGNEQHDAYGTACRKPDGSWEIVS